MSEFAGKCLAVFRSHYQSFRRIARFKSHDQNTIQGTSDERYRRILLTGGSTLIVKLFSVGINLLTVPLTLTYLGVERYGLWMAISSIIALMSFADLGIGNGLLNAISKAKGLNNKQDAQTAVSSTFYILIFVSLVLFTVFFCLYPFVEWYKIFNVRSVVAKMEAGPTVIALVIPLLINMPLSVVQRIQEGYQEGFKFQLYLLLGTLFSFISLLVCVYMQAGLPWLVFAYSAGTIVASVINAMFIFARKYAYLKPSFKYFKPDIGRKLIRAGLIFFLLQLFTILATASDNIIIAQTLGASSIAMYEIVKKMFLVTMLTQFIIQPLWPAFAEAIEKKDMVWVKKTLKRALTLSIGAAAFIALPFLLFGKQIIALWVSSEYNPPWGLLTGFYFFAIFSNYSGVMSTFLNSGNLLKQQVLIFGTATSFSLVLKIYLAERIGATGVIWGTLISYVLIYVYPTYRLAKKYFKDNG